MQPREKISKSSWTLIEGIKDSTSSNIVTACHSGQLKIEANQVPVLLALIAASIDAGYHRGHNTLMKVVDLSLSEVERAAIADASMPALDKQTTGTKKK